MYPIKQLSDQKGLTFVEVLVAMVILAFLGAVLYGMLGQGYAVWSRSMSSLARPDVDVIVEKMTADLKNSFKFKDKVLLGAEESMSLYSLVATSQGAKRGSREGILMPVQVRYAYDRVKSAVVREEYPYATILYSESRVPPRVTQVLNKVKSFDLNYQYLREQTGQFEWTNNWRKQCMPRGIKFDLQFESSVAEGSVSRLIPISTGVCRG